MIRVKNAGLFIHWGMNTGNKDWLNKCLFKDFDEFERAVEEQGWSAEKWIKAAKMLHASYITLACFHCCLGYLKVWKSDIPGTHSTKRDFLRELIDAGKKENIKIVIYISGDTSGKERYEGFKWIDADAYRKYKNDNSIDILDHDIWQTVYCRDIIGELVDNYPDLGGFWFDGWFCKENAEELFKFIHEKNHDIVNIRNNFGTGYFDNENLMSIENFGKVCSPEFDIVSGCWQGDIDAEVCYFMKKISNWWYREDFEPYFGTEYVKTFITIAANGWIPKVGIGPKIGGDFPENAERFLDLCEEYLSWAEESVFDIKPGIIPQCHIPDNGYIVTTYKPEDKAHYIHILKAPLNNVLRIKDAGLDFNGAIDLKTGRKMEFIQENGELVFKDDFSRCEEECDVVIKLWEEDNRIIVKNEILENSELPCTINIELEKETKIDGIFLWQKNNSCQFNGSWGGVDNNRLKDYVVIGIEESGKETVLKEGSLNGVRGNAQINFNANVKKLKLICKTAHDTNLGSVYIYKENSEGWKKLDYNDVRAFARIYSCDYVLDNDGVLNCHENGEKTILRKNVNYIFAGEDNVLYYIDNHNNIKTVSGKDTGFVGEYAAVDSEGNIFFITNNQLYKNGEFVDDGVIDVCVHDGALEYCKPNLIVKVKDNEKTVTKYDYLFKGITKKTFLLDDGTVLLRDVKGKDDTVYATGAVDVIYNGEKSYVIKPTKKGVCNIDFVGVIKSK